MRNLAVVAAIALCINLIAYPQSQPATASIKQDALADQFARLTPVVHVPTVPPPVVPLPLSPKEEPPIQSVSVQITGSYNDRIVRYAHGYGRQPPAELSGFVWVETHESGLWGLHRLKAVAAQQCGPGGCRPAYQQRRGLLRWRR